MLRSFVLSFGLEVWIFGLLKFFSLWSSLCLVPQSQCCRWGLWGAPLPQAGDPSRRTGSRTRGPRRTLPRPMHVSRGPRQGLPVAAPDASGAGEQAVRGQPRRERVLAAAVAVTLAAEPAAAMAQKLVQRITTQAPQLLSGEHWGTGLSRGAGVAGGTGPVANASPSFSRQPP